MADDTEVIELQDARKKRQTTRGSAYRAPALPAVRFLSDAHRAHLRDTSGLNDETISLANVYSVDSRNEAIELLGRVSNLPRGSLLVLPFYLPGGAEPYAYRVRPDEPRVVRAAEGEQKPRVVKYDQPSGAGVMVYYAPRARASGAYRDVAQPLYWTEGEKKALALDQLGYTTVGLTGVWNWSDPEARKAHAWALHARIREHVQIAGREHVIVFDRDAATNRDVAQAMRQLARTLRAAGARSVFVVLPPEYTEAKGIDDYLVAAGVDALRELLAFRPAEYAAHDAPTDSKVVTLASLPALRDAPLPDGLVLPDGWDVDSAGRVWAGGKEVMSRVMVVARRSVDTNTGECWADLVFHPGDRRGWQVLTVPRRALLDARAMAGELMPRGAPVHGGTARGATAWFLALELANARALEPERSVSSTGWVGSDAFMLHELVFANEALGLVPSPILGRLTPALTPRGSVDAHESALRAAWASSPVQRVAICAALAAPLLRPFDLRSFALHLCGDSSRGKTTMLRIAASVFGDPNDPLWVASWNATNNALEFRAAMLNDLPQCYDEAGVISADDLRRNVYTLINGEGRARGNKELSVRWSPSWRTIVLSSGESELTDPAGPTGAQARVINLMVDGFGTLDGDSNAIDALLRQCADNAGMFGQRWVSWLVSQTEAERVDMREQLRELQAEFVSRATQHQRRLAGYAATLMLVERLLVAAFGFEAGDGVLDVLGGLSRGEEYTSVPTAADHMADVLEDWMSVNQQAFPVAEYRPSGAFKVRGSHHVQRFGVRIVDNDDRVVETLIVRSEFDKLCRSQRRNPTVVLRDWAARALIETSNEGDKQRFMVARSEYRQTRQRWIVWLGRTQQERS